MNKRLGTRLLVVSRARPDQPDAELGAGDVDPSEPAARAGRRAGREGGPLRPTLAGAIFRERGGRLGGRAVPPRGLAGGGHQARRAGAADARGVARTPRRPLPAGAGPQRAGGMDAGPRSVRGPVPAVPGAGRLPRVWRRQLPPAALRRGRGADLDRQGAAGLGTGGGGHPAENAGAGRDEAMGDGGGRGRPLPGAFCGGSAAGRGDVPAGRGDGEPGSGGRQNRRSVPEDLGRGAAGELGPSRGRAAHGAGGRSGGHPGRGQGRPGRGRREPAGRPAAVLPRPTG